MESSIWKSIISIAIAIRKIITNLISGFKTLRRLNKFSLRITLNC